MTTSVTCAVETCNAKVLAKSFCSKHYQRYRSTGDPIATRWGMPAQGLPLRECEVCGSTFQPYRESTSCCSQTCRNRHPGFMERKNASRRLATASDPAKVREKNLRNALRRYNMTPDELRRLTAEQNNRCATCGAEPDPNGIKAAARLHVDHDHITGRLRKLLCNRCNLGVGYFRDDPALLRVMADYIEAHRILES
jgi:hypothetical protein